MNQFIDVKCSKCGASYSIDLKGVFKVIAERISSSDEEQFHKLSDRIFEELMATFPNAKEGGTDEVPAAGSKKSISQSGLQKKTL